MLILSIILEGAVAALAFTVFHRLAPRHIHYL